MTHWTDTYKTHANVIYEVDRDIYQNDSLTQSEMRMVDKILDKAGRRLPTRILDLACGVGRHSTDLCTRGHNVIGVDYSLGFLEIAESKAKDLPISFLQSDGRNLPFVDRQFGAVTLLGNSFGFFGDEDNAKMFREVSRVLHSGGLFVFDITDRDVFLKTFKPYSRITVQTKIFGTVVDERWREWNADTNTLMCRKRHTSEDGVLLDTSYQLRLYGQAEMKKLLRDAGFVDVFVSAYDEGLQLGAMSSRLFFLACK
jgi:ubiquinone/menaquinone biosynthesis C-methylase UbiE